MLQVPLVLPGLRDQLVQLVRQEVRELRVRQGQQAVQAILALQGLLVRQESGPQGLLEALVGRVPLEARVEQALRDQQDLLAQPEGQGALEPQVQQVERVLAQRDLRGRLVGPGLQALLDLQVLGLQELLARLVALEE